MKCFNCDKKCDAEMLCYGCKSFVCEKCEINTNMPWGSHEAVVHLDDDEWHEDE